MKSQKSSTAINSTAELNWEEAMLLNNTNCVIEKM